MRVLTALFCNDTVASRADARFEILMALAIKLIILISVDALILSMYLIKFYENLYKGFQIMKCLYHTETSLLVQYIAFVVMRTSNRRQILRYN